MKTPKRDYKTPANRLAQDIESDFFEPEYHAQESRWKRKNRIKKYKNTISLLRHRLKDTENCLELTQKCTKWFLVRPDHWHPMDENGNQLTRKQWKKKQN